MRFSVLTISMILAMTIAGCGEKTTSLNDEPIQASAATIRADGLMCPKCANNVTLQLEKIQGVEDIRVNMNLGTIRVKLTGDHHPSEAELAQAIKDGGFTFRSVKEGDQ